MRTELVEGAGNRFVLVDAFDEPLRADPAELARRACALARADGLLVLSRPSTAGADVAMLVHNADGSRAEACGNGLRCLAVAARAHGRVHDDELVVATDRGPRRVRILRAPDGGWSGARAAMGPARVLEEALEVELPDGTRVRGAHVDVGNPHFVLAVEDERRADVGRLGASLERHRRFPEGVNVGFLATRDGALRLRVFERGVGETAACGSGACAAALVARGSALARSPCAIEMAGGTLVVGLDARGEPWLEGPVRLLGALELVRTGSSAR